MHTPFRDALAALAQLVVPGVAHNYDIDAVPDVLGRAQLPALLVLPLDWQDRQPFRERGTGFEAIGFSSGGQSVTYRVTHLLVLAPVQSSKGARAHLPGLVTTIDQYMAALGADVRLGGTLLEPAQVHIEPGTYTLGAIAHHGCAFRHTWLVGVGSG